MDGRKKINIFFIRRLVHLLGSRVAELGEWGKLREDAEGAVLVDHVVLEVGVEDPHEVTIAWRHVEGVPGGVPSLNENQRPRSERLVGVPQKDFCTLPEPKVYCLTAVCPEDDQGAWFATNRDHTALNLAVPATASGLEQREESLMVSNA